MGREIRRVPPNWQHPKRDCPHSPWKGGCDDAISSGGKCCQPLYDQHVDDAFAEWLGNFDRIRRGEMTDIERECYPRGLVEWLQDDGRPPDPAYYRTYKDEEATWFQVYQTVSEGTPVSPPFPTEDELIDYLAAHGDFWSQRRGATPPTRQQAEQFVKDGWGVSATVTAAEGKVLIQDAYGNEIHE